MEEGPYTCVTCGHKKLRYIEITFHTDKDDRILEFTIQCKPCFLKSTEFQKVALQTSEAKKTVKKLIDHYEKGYNYEERVVSDAVEKA